MTIADTVPYASVLESDDYFDTTNNHMYCSDWTVTDAGATAQVTTHMSLPLAERLTFVAKDPGIAGNLVSVDLRDWNGSGWCLNNCGYGHAYFDPAWRQVAAQPIR